ncbi:glutathione synthetase [Bordetella ansorpii]|uniref:Glutathione synthetase n=1 Tax=Bordetella ansorpii TaxID=288768 RepID=A0A157SNM5_9BORD|nr:glutathione synthase [Bordetella ansorpii]SAI71884.1 glutathione synthetase [Bordetella ansorpii]
MHVLFVIDPLPLLKAYKDSSVAMMRALSARGHTLSVTLQGDLYIDEGIVKARTTAIELVEGADLHEHAWWREVGPHAAPDGSLASEGARPPSGGRAANGYSVDLPLSAFDAVIMRKDPPFDMEYVYSTHLLEYAQAQGARVFNSGAAIRNHPEKLTITEFADLATPTLVTRDMDRLKAFHAQHQDVIVKPLDGMGGTGIFRLRAEEPNRNAILETLTDNGQRTIMAQRYIPEIVKGDKRILLIGGEPVPYCLARIPLAGETRGNLAAGGRGVAQPLSDRDRQIAATAAERLAGRGLLLVGLDVIGDYVTEVNVTSPTCFVEITEQTGFNVGEMFAKALERAVG